jgi:hypothetical protein
MARAIPARLTAAAGRRFAFTVGAALLVLAGIVAWRGARPVALALGAIGGLLGLAGIVAPTRLGPVERAWYAFAAAISKVTTPIIMGVLYFVVLTPAGLLMRALGYNPLVRPPGSAWVRRPDGARRSDLERQF